MHENDVARLYIFLDNLFDVRVAHGGLHVSFKRKPDELFEQKINYL